MQQRKCKYEDLAVQVIRTNPIDVTGFNRAVMELYKFFEQYRNFVWLEPHVCEMMLHQAEKCLEHQQCCDEQRTILEYLREISREGKETEKRVICHSQNRNLQAQLSKDKAESDEQKQKEAIDEMQRAHEALFVAFKKFETAVESAKMATDRATCTQKLAQEFQNDFEQVQVDGVKYCSNLTTLEMKEKCVVSVLEHLAEKEKHTNLSDGADCKHGVLEIPVAFKRVLECFPELTPDRVNDLGADALNRKDPLSTALCCTLGLHGFPDRGRDILTLLLKLYPDSREVHLAMYLEYTRGRSPDHGEDCLAHLKYAVDKGLPCAKYLLSQCSWVDKTESTRLLTEASGDKHAASMLLCALSILDVHEVDGVVQPVVPESDQEQEQAKECYKLLIAATERGSSQAEYYAGCLRASGCGTLKDLKKSREHFHRAAKELRLLAFGDWRYGCCNSMTKYALALKELSDRLPSDELPARHPLKDSLKWMCRAARQGCKLATKEIDTNWYEMATEYFETEDAEGKAQIVVHPAKIKLIYDLSPNQQCKVVKAQHEFNLRMVLGEFDVVEMLKH